MGASNRLYERRRPTRLEDVVAQPEAVSTIRTLAERGELGGQAIWIDGPSGSGKTTLARIISNLIAEPLYVTEVDATDVDLDQVRSWEHTWTLCGGSKQGDKYGRAFIVNEAHGLRPPIVRRLLTALEDLRNHVCVIFTTTSEGQQALFEGAMDAGPLLSRCHCITLQPPMRRSLECAIYLRTVAQAESLDGASLDDYLALVTACKGNLRSCMQAIGEGKMRKEAA